MHRMVARLSLILVLVGSLASGCANPLNRKDALDEIASLWKDKLDDLDHRENAQMYILAPELGLDQFYSSESVRKPFHTASVGKLFTMVAIVQLIEDGRLHWDSKVYSILGDTMDGLFIVDGSDYSDAVTVEQLLAHTSGIADYFSDASEGNPSVADLMLQFPERTWTPDELLQYNRNHLNAVFVPGNGFHYSDTGYLLLGLIVEKLSGMPFHRYLQERIFRPLAMLDTYMPGRSQSIRGGQDSMGTTWFEGREISGYKSITVDWAGGGIVSTLEDLMRFNRALFTGGLLEEKSLDRIKNFQNKFETGIYCGTGIMEYRFEDFFPLLSGYPRWQGHLGILATHLIFDPQRNISIVMNLGSNDYLEDSFRLLIDVSEVLMRIRNPNR
ncbi:MAG: beta-lactamase family protein [Leptospiraceae bacterium]|nr:beta-lactamase family protein [Leptospiraceae bacterium]